MKKIRVDRHFFNTFATVAILVIAMCVALLYVFNFLLKNQTQSRKDYLLGQSQITANAVSMEMEAFRRDLYFFSSQYQYEEPHGSLVESGILNMISKHAGYIKSVTVFANGEARRFQVDESGSVSDIYMNIAAPAFHEQEILFESNRQKLYLSWSGSGIVFDLDLHTYLSNVPSTFIDLTSGFSLLLKPGGGGVVDLDLNTTIADNVLLHEKTFAEVQDLREAGLSDVFEGIIEKNRENEDVLIAFYPIEIFDESYGLALGVTKSNVTEAVVNGFLIIGGGIILFTGLILFVILRYVKSLKDSREQMDKNRKELEDLVNQQKLLFEYSSDFTYRHDLKFNFSYISENVLKVLGYTPEEFADPKYRRFTENPINKEKDEAFNRILQGISESENFFVEMRNRKDEPVILEMKEKPYFNQKGTFAGVIGIAKDVTDRFMSDQKFKMLFEYSSDPHLIFTQSKGILDCNEAAVKALGAESKEQLYGKPPHEFSPEMQPDNRNSKYKGQEVVQQVLDNGKYVFDWTHKKVNGEEFPVEVTLTTVLLNQEKVILAVWHDLTERKRVEKVLIEGRQRAESLARSKQQFLSGMSHEIRTPLNAVIGYTDFLLEENPREDQKEKLEALKFSADNLLNLVQDILDHSVVESGKLEFSSEPFSLKTNIVRVAQMMKQKAEVKGVELTYEFDKKLPDEIIGDPNRLRQILINIISNAVKFTDEGSVKIKSYVISENETHHEIGFKVEDTGIGIPKDRQEVVFNTFEQGNLNILNKYGGTGLGLAITKKLVELQGGTIAVESEQGKGSIFTVEITFRRSETKIERHSQPGIDTKVEKPRTNEGDFSGASALVVEDNPINQKIAERFLKSRGASVTIASNGKEALDVVSGKNYDFVLMDIQMPEMDGYEATKAIRKIDDPYFQKLPIICLTADAFSEVRDRVLEAGMTDYVTKPISKEKFFKVLGKYYNRK